MSHQCQYFFVIDPRDMWKYIIIWWCDIMYSLFSKLYWKLFFLIKNWAIFKSDFHFSISTNISFYYFGCAWLILFFFKVIYILQNFVIVHYVFLVSLVQLNFFKLQIIIQNFHSLKKITMIIKFHHKFTIDRHIQIYSHVDCLLI